MKINRINVNGGPRYVSWMDLNTTTATKFVSVSRENEIIKPFKKSFNCERKIPVLVFNFRLKITNPMVINPIKPKAKKMMAQPGYKLKLPSGLF